MMLTDILDAEEIRDLSEECKRKFESFVTRCAQTTEMLREENAQLKARCERSSFQLETALSDYRAQTSTLEDACKQAKQRAAQFGADLDACRVELGAAKVAAAAANASLEATKRNLEQVEQEKIELFQAMEKKMKDLATLGERVESLQVELRNNQQQLRERAVQLEELNLQLVSSQHVERRLRQEQELLQSQLSDLRDEAMSYRQEAAQLRREKAGLAVDLQAKLNSQEDQVRSLNSQLAKCQSSTHEQKQQVESLTLRLREAEEGRATLEARFSQELQAQAKLTDMHKELSESQRVRVDKLVGSLENMRALLLETRDAAEGSHQALEEAQVAHAWELAEREAALEELRQELRLANSQLQQATGGGVAAHVSGLAQESGMSLTELLTERLEQQQALWQALRERDSLQLQLSELSSELADKMPLIVRNMQEYERAVSSIACLREQLTGALVEQEQRARERDDARCALDHAQRSLQRCQQEAQDLSQQVCRLLQEVEEARGGAVVPSQDQAVSSTEDGAAAPPLTAAEVISRRLVTFGSRELHERLEGALVQLQELEQERSRQAAMVACLVNQRDMYRTLLAAKGYQDLPLASTENADKLDPGLAGNTKQSSDKPTGSQAKPGRTQDANAALDELQQEFDTYKKEMAENYRVVSEQLSGAQEASLRLRLEAARREAELTHVRERLALAQGNLGPLQQEAAALRERSANLVDTLVQHQQALVTLRQELSTSQDAESRAQILLESARAERDQLRETNARLERDLESERREKSSQARILANLQTLQLNLERMDVERRGAEQSKLSQLKLRCESLTRQLESQSEQQGLLAASLEQQLREARERASAEAERARKAADELVGAYAQLYEAQKQLSENQSLRENAEGSEIETAEVIALKGLLTKSENRVKELEKELCVAKEHVEFLQTACSQWEARAAEQDDLNVQSRGTVHEMLQAKQELEHKVSQLEQANHELTSEKVRLLEESKTKVKELERELSASQTALTAAQGQIADQSRRDAEHVIDQDAQSTLTKQAQEKYERELLLHAADIEALSATRAELEQVKQETSRLERQARSAEETLAAARESWSEQEKQLLVEKENLANRVEELSQQNTLLYLQFETLTSQVAVLKQRKRLVAPTGADTLECDGAGSEEADRSGAEQLREVVRFLRREKELVGARAEAAEAESARLAVQLEQRSASLQQAQQELQAERDRALAHATSDAQHAELLRKVEMVELLTESNQTLRGERLELASTKRELEKRCDQLERELAPLREEVQSRVAQAEALQADVTSLREEVQRWRQRTNQLLEQSSHADSEAVHKLTEENEALKREALKLKEELAAVGQQLALNREEMADREHRLATAAAETQAAQSELSSRVSTLKGELREAGVEAQAETERLHAEAEKSAAELRRLREEKEEKLRTIIQLKKIARHYRSQFEEVQRAKEALDRRCAQLEEAQGRAALEGLQARSEREVGMRTLQEEKDALAEQLEQAKAASANLAAEKERAVSAAQQTKALLLQTQQRNADFNAENEALVAEKRTLEQRVEDCQQRIAALEQINQECTLRENNLQVQYEGKLLRLNKEVQEAWGAFERSQCHVEELTQKLRQQQKHSKPTMVTAPVERAGNHGGSAAGEPVTASVRPLTPPPQSVVPPLQRQGPSGARLTARIGPLTQATRLATVAPTAPVFTVTTPTTPTLVANSEGMPFVPTASAATARAQQQPEVLPSVMATVGSFQEATEAPSPDEPFPRTTHTQTLEPEPEIRVFVPTSTGTVAEARSPQASGSGALPVASANPSSHGSSLPDGFGSHKRERDSDQAPFSSGTGRLKRLKPTVADATSSSTPDATSLRAEPTEGGVPISAAGCVVEEPQQSDDDDVIVVESDNDDDLQDDDPKVDFPEKTESSSMEEDDENEEGTASTEEADGPEEQEDMAETESQDDTDDDGEDDYGEVEIVDFVQDEEEEEDGGEDRMEGEGEVEDEEEDQTLSPPSSVDGEDEESMGSAPSEMMEEATPSLLVAPVRSERLPLGQSVAGFEDGDDGVVPSSPMLCVPQETDDPAEANGSPRAPHGEFVFGPEGRSELEASDLLELASQEGGVGVVEEPSEEEEGEEEQEETPLEGEPLSLSEEEEGEGAGAASESDASSAALVPEAQELESQGPPSSSASPEPIVEEPSDTEEEEEPGEAPSPQPVVTGTRSPSLPVPIAGGVVAVVGEGEPEEEEREEEGESSSSEPDASDVGPAAAISSSDALATTEEGTPSGVSSPPASSQQSAPPKRRRIVWEDPEPSSSSSVSAGGARQATSPAHIPLSSVSMRTRSALASEQARRGLPLGSSRRLQIRGALPRGQGAGSPRRRAGLHGMRAEPRGRGVGHRGRGAELHGRGRAAPMWSRGRRSGSRPPRGSHSF
ncbi:uncharacterized protein LOC144138158 isoform X2 [Haemaphysalis longicornis]